MPSFPNSVFAPPTRSNGQTIDASHINGVQDEVVAIEDGYRNATAPLNSSNSTLANLSVTGGSTLGAVTFGSTVRFASSATFGAGLNVSSGGLVVSSGGVTISSGGLTVSTANTALGQNLNVAGDSSFVGAINGAGLSSLVQPMTLSSTRAGLTLANAGTQTFSMSVGMLLIYDGVNNLGPALYGISNSTSAIIWQNGTAYSSTGAEAGKISLSASAGTITITNNSGLQGTFRTFTVRIT